MTTHEKIEDVRRRVGNDPLATDEVVVGYLLDAAEAIFARKYPFGIPETVTEVPRNHERLQCKLAARYFFRNGGEGELIHNENGIQRHYGSVNDDDLLMEVIQEIRM